MALQYSSSSSAQQSQYRLVSVSIFTGQSGPDTKMVVSDRQYLGFQKDLRDAFLAVVELLVHLRRVLQIDAV